VAFGKAVDAKEKRFEVNVERSCAPSQPPNIVRLTTLTLDATFAPAFREAKTSTGTPKCGVVSELSMKHHFFRPAGSPSGRGWEGWGESPGGKLLGWL